MTNCPLTLRTLKGSKLTFNELDNNFLSLAGCIDTLQSNIYGNFLPLSGGTLTGPLSATTGIYTNDLYSLNDTLTVWNNIVIQGNVTINGSATTINTQVVQSQDNLIILNYSGNSTTADGGGMLVVDAQGTGVPSSITVDSNGMWVFDPGFSASTATIDTLSACSAIHTSNIYGCSPITVHDSLQNVGSTANGLLSTALGNSTLAQGNYSHAEGRLTIASGESSHSEGALTTSIGLNSHAEGGLTTSIGINSHAEGGGTIANGAQSHAEGDVTVAIGSGSHAEGSATTSIGGSSHAEGGSTTAFGGSSHAEGEFTKAIGEVSHAEGYQTNSIGDYSHAEGYNSISGWKGFSIDSVVNGFITLNSSYGDVSSIFTSALLLGTNLVFTDYATFSSGTNTEIMLLDTSVNSGGVIAPVSDLMNPSADIVMGNNSHAEGNYSKSFGSNSHAEGDDTWALGWASHSEGYRTTAIGDQSHVEGYYSQTEGNNSHAEGQNTTAFGDYGSHSEGWATSAVGIASHAEGASTTSYGNISHSEGAFTTATGAASHAEGNQTTAIGDVSHVENFRNVSIGNYSHAEGGYTTSIGTYSHSEGYFTTAIGDYSHSEGWVTTASGESSHSEGYLTTARGKRSHAEGEATKAIGIASHAEGSGSEAIGNESHAEGGNSTAIGNDSHAEGKGTISIGTASHAEGSNTITIGNTSHAEGWGTKTYGTSSHAGGYYSVASGETSFIHSTNSLVIGDRSVVLGGQNITGTTSDTVYVPYLNIKNLNSNTPLVNIGVDSSGNVVSGNTGLSSGSCISDFYVSNIHACSPLRINPLDEGDVYFGSTSAVTIDLSNNRVGIGTTTPTEKLEVNGKTKTTNLQITSGATAGYILTSDASGNASWQILPVTSGKFGISDSGGTYTYYSSLSSAMSAATTGQTIEVFADYTESGAVTITLKNGVNINGNGHTYNYTNATGDCFIDNGVAVTCTISDLTVVRTNYTSGSIYVQSSSSSDTDWSGSKLYMTANSGYGIQLVGTIRNCWTKISGNGTAIYSAYFSGAKLYNSYGESTGSGTGLDIRTSTVVNSTGISVSGRGAFGDQSVFSNCYLSATSGYGVEYGQYTNCTVISTSGQACRLANANNCTILSTSGYCAVSQNNTFTNCTLKTSSASVTYFQTYNYNCTLITDTNTVNQAAFNPEFYNCTIITNWNNAAGHALLQPGPVVNCYIAVSNASANCIYNSSPQTLKYSNNVFKGATTPVNANITQGIVNTQDNQGNILL